MNKIIFTDSALYEMLLEVCDSAYMPKPVCVFTNDDNSEQLNVDAISVKITEPITAAVATSRYHIKTYISEFINTSLKRYGKSFCFYPFKVIKSNKGTSLILRGAFQKAGWTTGFKETDKQRIKTELDRVELSQVN